MSILDKATVIDTGERAPIKVRFNETSELVTDLSFLARSKYEISLSVSAMFFANKAEYHTARRQAERILLHTLYEDTLARIDFAINLMMNDEPYEALKYLESVREELTK